MSYCINPHCKQRQNPEHLETCQACGTPLLINEQYRLLQPLRPLDSNSYTDVFEVVDEKGTWLTQPGTHQVMKVLKSTDSKLIQLMEREALVLQSINYPGIPRCDVDGYFSFTPNGSSELHCLVIDKIEGQTLEQWLEAHGRLSQSLALNWLKQLVEILDQVHQAGFFHRDIKPSNIILKPDGQLALIDFGAVRGVSETYLAKLSSGLSSSGRDGFFDVTVVRTACYAPLEQINGKAVPQSDFYALGRTFAHLLTGINLINLPEDQQTARLIWRNKAPQIDKPLADFIDWLMAPAPGKRPQNTQVILQYLNERLPLLLKLSRFIRSIEFRVGVVVLITLAVAGAYKGVLLWASSYYFDQASEEQLANQLEDAKRNYELAIKYNPKNPTTHNNLGLVCQGLRNFDCAVNNYKQALKLRSDYWATHYNLGNLYDEQGNYAAAEKQYRLAIQSDSNLGVDAINNLSRLKNRTKDYKAAIELAVQGLQRTNDPISQAALYKNLGWAKLEQNRYAEAKTYLQKALELDPERTDAYCLMAQVQEAQSDRSGANLSWEVCLRMDSDLPEVREWRDKVLQRLLQ